MVRKASDEFYVEAYKLRQRAKKEEAKKAAEAKAKKAQPKRTTARAKTPKTPRATIIPVSPPKTPKVTGEYSLEFLQGALAEANENGKDIKANGEKIEKLTQEVGNVSQKVGNLFTKVGKITKDLFGIKTVLSGQGAVLELHDNDIAVLKYCVFGVVMVVLCLVSYMYHFKIL